MNLAKLVKEESPIFIDVREPYEFAAGHVDGAENIPLGSIPAFIDRFRNESQHVIFYCRSGMRSGQAVAFLESVGVRTVYNGGGLEEAMALAKMTV
jgi:rhodanese-related sulfurtransferase